MSKTMRGILGVALTATLLPACWAARMYVGGPTGEVYMGDSVKGNFTYFTCGCIPPINSMTTDDKWLYLVDTFGNVFRVEPRVGLFTGFFTVTNTDGTAAVKVGDDLLVSGSNKTIVRVNATNGALQGTLSNDFDIQAMTLNQGELLIGSQMGIVQAGDPLVGEFGSIGICGGPVNSMAVLGDGLFLGTPQGHIYRIDLRQGFSTMFFELDTDAAAMLVDGGDLLVGGSNQTVYRVNPENGAIKSTFTVPIPVSAMAIFSGGCSSDINADGLVTDADLGLLLSALGSSLPEADLDGSGFVDDSDLGLLLGNFGTNCD